MVSISTIQSANAAFAADKHSNQVAVFIGATSGIGDATLDTFASLLVQPKIYVVGRSAARFEKQRERLQKLNPEATIVFVEAEISLLKEVDKACKAIVEKEKRVDYLCMSSGYLPVAGAKETEEGLEQCFVLSYYARLRFLHNLLPVLRHSARPRVLSILNGGGEGPINTNDLGLENSWTIFNLVNHATTFMTLMLYRFASHPGNEKIAFIHAGPGQVETHTDRKPQFADASGIWAQGTFLAMKGLMYVLRGVMARPRTAGESGERHAYLLTSESFGAGAWRVKENCEEAGKSELVERYRKESLDEKIWEFTKGVWGRVLRD